VPLLLSLLLFAAVWAAADAGLGRLVLCNLRWDWAIVSAWDGRLLAAEGFLPARVVAAARVGGKRGEVLGQWQLLA